MKNTDSSEKHFDRELLNRWLARGAKFLLPIFAAGLIPFIVGFVSDVRDLQAKGLVQDVKIKVIEDRQTATSDKVDDLHWYLIRRKDVKIDKKK